MSIVDFFEKHGHSLPMQFKENIIYYSHWHFPDFDVTPFKRWPTWEEYAPRYPLHNVYDYETMMVSRTNFKIFFHPEYPKEKLSIIVKILDQLGFDLEKKLHDRFIFRYRSELSVEEVERETTYLFLRNLLDAFVEKAVSRVEEFKFFDAVINTILDKADDKIAEKALRMERKRKVSVTPNELPHAGFFIRPHSECRCRLTDCSWKEEKCYVRSYKHAVLWKRYYVKVHRDYPPLVIGSASLHFKENDFLPGGCWMDGENSISSAFYPAPPSVEELCEPSECSLSDEFVHLELDSTIPCKTMEMINFYNVKEKRMAGRTYKALTYGDVTIASKELYRYLLESERKRAVFERNDKFSDVVIEKIDYGEEITVEYNKVV
jgi:hypothetical protein